VSDLFRWDWVVDNSEDVWLALGEHVWLTFLAVAIGLAISVPIGVFVARHRRFYGPVTAVTGFLYTIPSLALFAFLTPLTGLSTTSAEIGLVGYTLLILIRNVVAGLDGVSPDAKEAARGMGYTERQLLWKVEMPLALPTIVAGVRIATVTTVGLVTVTALIGKGGVGYFILLGLSRTFSTAIILGAALAVILAVGFDLILLRTERLLAPWSRRSASRATA
jgi:osmoprotectant transport system permease protein